MPFWLVYIEIYGVVFSTSSFVIYINKHYHHQGALTLAWVEKKCILTREDMPVINSHEYIGALSDFTGDYMRIRM
jgi:hypothetical protein